jgi:hypothetical protein
MMGESMEQKALLQQLWKLATDKREACRFQLYEAGGPIEYLVSSTAVLLDYKPETTLEPGKMFQVEGLPKKNLQDASLVNPNTFLSEESLVINNDDHINKYFLPLGGGYLGVFAFENDKAVEKDIMPFLKDGCFKFAGLAFTQIPPAVQAELAEHSTLTALHARISKVRTNSSLAVVLSCDTAMLVVTLARVKPTKPENENIYLASEDRYKLDGFNEEFNVFSRLVKANNKDMSIGKGLASPVQRKVVTERVTAAVTTPPAPPVQAEVQVEEIKPEQAEQIAEAAPAPVQAPAEEPKKRVPAKKPASSTTINSAKSVDELITYLGSPIPDGMTAEALQEEVRKLRDLGVVIARRQSNLFSAATASEKKLRDVLKGVLG